MINTIDSLTQKICYDLARQQEAILQEQLGDLVSRGLLVVESTEPVLIREPYSDKIKIAQSIKLTLKDKEYILKLEEENKILKEQLETIKNVIGEIK